MEVIALLDALEAGLQQRREGQVGVAGRVRAAQLHPRALLGAGVIQRHPHQRGAVAPRPGDVDGRLIAGHQPLVGVDPLGEDRADLARVAQLAGDEGLADRREEVVVVGVEEGVTPGLEQRLVGVHPGAVLAEHRLGHEGRVPAVFERDLLDRDPVGHAVVGHLQRVGVAHVDLVLRGPALVVAVLDMDAERLERDRGLAPHVRARVERGQVEVAAAVERLGPGAIAKQEVLELRARR